MNNKTNTGTLFLIPTMIGISPFAKNIPEGVKDITCSIKEFIAEDARTARRYLKSTGYPFPLDEVIFHVLNKNTVSADIPDFLNSLLQGKNVGLLSESGMPCIADPGAIIVRLAHQYEIKVVPLPGPSSILLSLIASGMNGQNFVFHGYLPIDKTERKKKLREIESLSYIKDQTQIFIETPYRNKQMFEDIIRTCRQQTQLCIACEITSEFEYIKTMKISEWLCFTPDINKKNTVFLIYKG